MVANVRLDVGEIFWEAVDWMHLVQETDLCLALVYVVMKLWVS